MRILLLPLPALSVFFVHCMVQGADIENAVKHNPPAVDMETGCVLASESCCTQASTAKAKRPYPTYDLRYKGGRLLWELEKHYWVLNVFNKGEKLLAKEGEFCGYHTYIDGAFHKLRIPADTVPTKTEDGWIWCWRQKINHTTATVSATYTPNAKRDAVDVVVSFEFDKPVNHPHFSWGLALNVEKPLDAFRWTSTPTSASYSFNRPIQTFWIMSRHSPGGEVTKFDGCQALLTVPGDPLDGPDRPYKKAGYRGMRDREESLRTYVRMPPGYEEPCLRENLLPAGTRAYLRASILTLPGFFDAGIARVHQLQPLEMLPARFGYSQYAADMIDLMLDPAKWFEEHKGIMYHCYGNSKKKNPLHRSGCDPRSPSICKGREGPGWGGGWDAQLTYLFLKYAKQRETVPQRKEQLRKHARRLLDGWLTNPKFVYPDTLTWKKRGDMRGALSPSMEARRRGHPPFVWTAHQGYMILWLSRIYELTGWQECLDEAQRVADWFLRNQQVDGSIPCIWAVDGDQAEIWIDAQCGGTIHMVTGLLELNRISPDTRLLQAARTLANRYVGELMAPLPKWGQGEHDVLIWCGGNAYDTTSLAYIVWAYADAFEQWKDPRYEAVLKRYAGMLLAQGVTWEPNEGLLRGPEKVECPPYGMDTKMAGGFTLGNFSHFYHFLISRDEVPTALMRAYEVLHDQEYLDWMVAHLHWFMGLVFTNEVEFSPATTYGGSPENLRWSSNRPNWANAWSNGALKYGLLILEALERGYISDEMIQPGTEGIWRTFTRPKAKEK